MGRVSRFRLFPALVLAVLFLGSGLIAYKWNATKLEAASQGSVPQMDYRHMTVIGQHAKAAWGLAMNAPEDVLVSGGNDAIIQVYELSTFKPLSKFKAKAPISSLALSNSAGELYVSSKIRKEIAIFTLDGNYVGSLEGGQPGVQSLLIHPDGKKLISRSGNSLVTLWDLDTKQQLASVDEPGFTEVQSMAISEDGSTLAIGGTGNIYLCGLEDMATGAVAVTDTERWSSHWPAGSGLRSV